MGGGGRCERCKGLKEREMGGGHSDCGLFKHIKGHTHTQTYFNVFALYLVCILAHNLCMLHSFVELKWFLLFICFHFPCG